MSKSHEDFLWGVLVGGCLGAMATLLTTPLTGTKLREELMKGLHNEANSKKKKPKTTKKATKR